MPRSRYSDRVPVAAFNEGPSMTKQSFKDECDVNNIIRSYDKTGIFTHLNETIPQYAVFTADEVLGTVDFDYHAALNIVRAADDGFEALPAVLRKRFLNDPGEFIKFVDDPENHDEAVQLGLVEAPAEPVVEPEELADKLKALPVVAPSPADPVDPEAS